MNKILLSLVFALIVTCPATIAKNLLLGRISRQSIPVVSMPMQDMPPAALGIIWDRNAGNRIVYRDNNSDVQCRVGDRLLAIEDMDPNRAVATGANIGPPDSEADVVILHNGEIWEQHPKRKIITCFSPTMRIFLHCRQSF
jgi:hypothetical protein